MRILGLDHLVLTVASIEATCDFYERALGMERVNFGNRRTALKYGSQKINLHEAGKEFEPKAQRPTPGSGDLCLLVDDLESAGRALERAGIAIIKGPVERTGAQGQLHSIYVRDPDGNLIELSVYASPLNKQSGLGIELLSTIEMARADQMAIDAGTPGIELMEAAGSAVARVAADMAPPPGPVTVLAGPGNNGGDGFVAARLLREAGYEVRLALLGDLERLSGDARQVAERWDNEVEPLSKATIAGARIIIDAIFGAGLARPIEGKLANLVNAVSAADAAVLAVDVPSGIDGNSGKVRGVAVRAAQTVTFFRRKPGHLLLPGRIHCGQVIIADIGIPENVLEPIAPKTISNQPASWRWKLPFPSFESHKYRRGHSVIVSGPPDMTGAARLGARAAMRAGSGLVTVASPRAAFAVNAAQLTTVMVRSFEAVQGLSDILSDSRKNAVLIGPGAGVSSLTRGNVEIVLKSGAAVVLDADAITSYENRARDLFGLIAAMANSRPVVLTPHEGEFKRLFGDLKGSKLDCAKQAAKKSGAIVVLKGPDTVIASPDGRAAINENAPPWLATAGSGDVLAGLVVGLLAQGMGGFAAACAAVWLHGEAANHYGVGLIAEDLPEQVPMVLKTLIKRQQVL